MSAVVFGTWEVLINENQHSESVSSDLTKLLNYLKVRQIKVGILSKERAGFDELKIGEDLDLVLEGNFLLDEAGENVYFLDVEKKRLEKARKDGFIPIRITEKEEEESCVCFHNISQFHTFLVQSKFEY